MLLVLQLSLQVLQQDKRGSVLWLLHYRRDGVVEALGLGCGRGEDDLVELLEFEGFQLEQILQFLHLAVLQIQS